MKNSVLIVVVVLILAGAGYGVWWYLNDRGPQSSLEILPPDPRLETFEQKVDPSANPGPNQFRVRDEGEVSVEGYFADEMQNYYALNVGQPIEGLEPAMLMQAFPGLAAQDFVGVAAEQGRYEYDEETDELSFVQTIPEGEPEHSAARALTERGFTQLLNNVSGRMQHPKDTTSDIDRLIGLLAAEGGEFGF